MNEINDIFGEVISVYTREQALADGVLVDLAVVAPDVCAQHFKYPVAATTEVWSIIKRAVENKRHCNDYKGVIHDILWMARNGRTVDATTRLFTVIITGAGRTRNFTFKIVCGPGDSGEPVLTIMLPNED